MDLKGQYNKFTKEQKANLNYIARLATILNNYKLWRKYWATKKDYLLQYELYNNNLNIES